MKQRKYSWSQLRYYEGCPWAYKKVYRDKVPREEYEGQKTGKELHAKNESYLNRLIRLKLQTDLMWAAAQQSSSKDVAEVWERFYNTFTMPAAMEDPGVEKKLGFTRSWQPCDFDAPEAFFRMVIDFHFRQNSLVVVRDWKST